MCFFVQTNHTRKELLFLMFKEINLRNHSSLHKLFYSLRVAVPSQSDHTMIKEKCFFVTVGNIFNKSRFLCNICKNHAIYEQNLTTK